MKYVVIPIFRILTLWAVPLFLALVYFILGFEGLWLWNFSGLNDFHSAVKSLNLEDFISYALYKNRK